jgi:tetratricopeptide (TPR) repeat protein
VGAMSTVDDLLSLRRRGELSDADERRLQIAVQTSPEHQLSLLASAAFDREGEAQPGDAALVRKIVRQVEGEWSGTFQRVSARSRLSRWVAIPLFAAGAAAASFGGYRALQALAPAPVAVSPVAVSPAAVSPAAVSPAAVPSIAIVVAPPPPVVARRPAPEARANKPVLEAARAPAAQPAVVAPGAVVPLVGADETARELFRRANRLRQSDWEAAASLYEQLTQRFSDSHEAGVAEMALAKHALTEGRATEALRWFRAYQERDAGEQAAEALWGEARALESIGERAHAQAIWRTLVEQYPASAYAAAAREQLGP